MYGIPNSYIVVLAHESLEIVSKEAQNNNAVVDTNAKLLHN